MNRTQPVLAYILGTFPGITETFIVREIESLRERGFEIIVCAVRRSDHPDLERSLVPEEIARRTIYARPDRIGRHLWANLRAVVRSPARYLSALGIFLAEIPNLKPYDIGRTLYHFYCGIGFVDELRERNVRHLHAHFVAGSNMALAAHLYSGISFSFTAHASGDIYRNATLLGEKIARCSMVLPVCEYNRRYLDSFSGYRYGSKLHRLYNTVESSEAHRFVGSQVAVERKENLGGPGRVLSVGSLVRMKGHATLVRACGLLGEKGYDLSCQIIGEGPERDVLERLIRDSGLQLRIALSGVRPLRDVYAAMAVSDIFVLLSEIDVDGYRDALPTVILEAMSLSLPVVSTWISGIPEMIEHGVTGFLVPERDAEAAADAIAALLEDPGLRRSFGAAGRKKLDDTFNPAVLADLRVRFFYGMMDGGPGP